MCPYVKYDFLITFMDIKFFLKRLLLSYISNIECRQWYAKLCWKMNRFHGLYLYYCMGTEKMF